MRYLIIDRDTKYRGPFRQMLVREGIKVIRLPPRSPNRNAYAEGFVRSIKEECLSKLIPIGQEMVRRALREYVEHYHWERNHQGIGNVLLMKRSPETSKQGSVMQRQRLGGLLNYYDRAAA